MRLAFALIAFALWSSTAAAQSFTIDSSAADAVVQALSNPNLTAAQAKAVSEIPGNAAVIKKVKSYSADATAARFADELYRTAHGQPLAGKSLFRFERTYRDLDGVKKTLAAIHADPAAFAAVVTNALKPYQPAKGPVQLKGFLVGGGSSTGFAYGPDFYLNISQFPDEPKSAQLVMEHELFHALHAASRPSGEVPDSDDPVVSLMDSLLVEGMATYVGDPAQFPTDKPYGKWEATRFKREIGMNMAQAIQLDFSLRALDSDGSLYGDAYGLGFGTEEQPLYYLGYTMVKAVAEQQGQGAIRAMMLTDGCDLLSRYQSLSSRPVELKKSTVDIATRHCASPKPVKAGD